VLMRTGRIVAYTDAGEAADYPGSLGAYTEAVEV